MRSRDIPDEFPHQKKEKGRRRMPISSDYQRRHHDPIFVQDFIPPQSVINVLRYKLFHMRSWLFKRFVGPNGSWILG